MAAESNMGFQDALGSPMNRHALSFQSGAINSTSEMIPGGNYYGFSVINNNHGMAQVGSSSGSLLLDPVPGLTHDTGLAVEWSPEEQYKLEEGLHKYAVEPSVMRYVKIAAMLRDKTARDVALRCRWMARKRRKADEHAAGKKVNSRKDKLVESSSMANIPSVAPLSMTPYSLMRCHMDQSKHMLHEVSGISGTAKFLLEQNNQAFSQISTNLSNYKLQDNINLFCQARSNIIAILNDMRDMPGIMSKMPPLPISINEDLANNVLPNSIQSMMYLKQEPRC